VLFNADTPIFVKNFLCFYVKMLKKLQSDVINLS
jgi:hypothetical protein